MKSAATGFQFGIRIKHIQPGKPQQNAYVERYNRTQQHASRIISDWITFYNHRRPHQSMGMKTPAQAYALAA
jgi:putative transposase